MSIRSIRSAQLGMTRAIEAAALSLNRIEAWWQANQDLVAGRGETWANAWDMFTDFAYGVAICLGIHIE